MTDAHRWDLASQAMECSGLQIRLRRWQNSNTHELGAMLLYIVIGYAAASISLATLFFVIAVLVGIHLVDAVLIYRTYLKCPELAAKVAAKLPMVKAELAVAGAKLPWWRM